MKRFYHLILGLAAFLSGPVLAAEPARLNIGTIEFPDILSFDYSLRVASQFALGPVLRPLVLPTSDLRFACELCAQMPDLANGGIVSRADGGLIVTYHLAKDWYWGDGVPVTAQDFAFTIELARTPKIGFVRSSIYAEIEKVETPDPVTLRLYFSKPRYDAGQLRITPLPEHIERKVLDRAGAEHYAQETMYVTQPNLPGLWNGPYLVADFKLRDHIIYRRNPFWRGTRPQFDDVILRAIDNTAALEQNLLSGDINYGRGLSLGFADRLVKSRTPDFDVDLVPSTGRQMLQVSPNNPWLADRRVRRALVLALDRETMARQHLGSAFEPALSFLPAGDPFFSKPPMDALGFDPKAARAILDEVGLMIGPDGIRQNQKGERVRVDLMIGAGDPAGALLAVFLQSAWREIGIEIQILPREQGEVYRQARELSYSGLLEQSWITAPGDPPRLVFHSSSVPTKANHFSGGNQSGYVNPEMDDLIDRSRLEIDPMVRRALMAQIQALYVRDLPEIPLFITAVPYVRPKFLTGLTFYPVDIGTYRIEDWRLSGPKP
jgi:peptide/nickel transport system substrate-binding protein